MYFPIKLRDKVRDLISNENRFYIFVMVLLVILGIVLRLRAYTTFRSLWLDEAMLARNIVDRSLYPLLFSPLDFNQGAPLLFLFFVKIIALLFGYSEGVLRVIPFFTGVLSILLILFISFRYIGKVGAIIALGLFVLSESLIYYSSELKQYSSDVFAGLIILGMTLTFLQHKLKTKHFIYLAIVGVTAGALSHPALFIISSAGVVLTLNFLLHKDFGALKRLMVVVGFWLLFYILLYFVSLRYLGANESLLNYWANQFMPLPPWKDWNWFRTALNELAAPFHFPFTITKVEIALLLIICTFSLIYRNHSLGLFILLVLTITLVASSIHKYPFGGRMLLFLYPLLFLLAGELGQRLYDCLRKIHPGIAVIPTALLILVIFFGNGQIDLKQFQIPQRGEDFKSVYQYYKEHKEINDYLYLYYSAQQPYYYYQAVYGLNDQNKIDGRSHRDNPEDYILELDEAGRSRRSVWFLFTHNCSWCKVNEEIYMREHLDRIGILRKEYHAEGASVYRYDFIKDLSEGIK